LNFTLHPVFLFPYLYLSVFFLILSLFLSFSLTHTLVDIFYCILDVSLPYIWREKEKGGKIKKKKNDKQSKSQPESHTS